MIILQLSRSSPLTPSPSSLCWLAAPHPFTSVCVFYGIVRRRLSNHRWLRVTQLARRVLHLQCQHTPSASRGSCISVPRTRGPQVIIFDPNLIFCYSRTSSGAGKAGLCIGPSKHQRGGAARVSVCCVCVSGCAKLLHGRLNTHMRTTPLPHR